RTLPASVAPVLVGAALALGGGNFDALAAVPALVGAMRVQGGTSASDAYCDARRGADTDGRLGPVRRRAGGLLSLSQVRRATWVARAARAGARALCASGGGAPAPSRRRCSPEPFSPRRCPGWRHP